MAHIKKVLHVLVLQKERRNYLLGLGKENEEVRT